jgi:hypothetical protein
VSRACSQCGEEKPHTAEFYYRDKRASSGLYSACKVCVDLKTRKYQKENAEWWRNYSRKFYQKNKLRLNAKRRQRLKRDPEFARVCKRATENWRGRNRQRVLRVNNKRGRERTENLEDCYVARILVRRFGFKNVADVPHELIGLKREHILLYREIEARALKALEDRKPKIVSLPLVSKRYENPCGSCATFLDGSGYQDVCVRCDARVEYVKNLEAPL